MLRALKKLYKYSIPFFGINCGTIGFLMNQNFTDLEKNISNSKSIEVNPIIAKVTSINN